MSNSLDINERIRAEMIPELHKRIAALQSELAAAKEELATLRRLATDLLARLEESKDGPSFAETALREHLEKST